MKKAFTPLQIRMYTKNRRFVTGFTLIELLIVIIIIGILATMAVPQYQKMVWKAKWSQAIFALDAIRKAELFYYSQYGKFVDGFYKELPQDYVTSSAEFTTWLQIQGIDMVEIPDKAFEYFNYDLHLFGGSGNCEVFAIKKTAPDPDPQAGNYGIKIDVLTGNMLTDHYPFSSFLFDHLWSGHFFQSL